MRKALVTFLLLCGICLAASAQSNPPANQKAITDQTEYSAYIAALNVADADQRGAALEGFARQYPKSVALVDALDQALTAYQQAGDNTGTEAVARRLLKVAPEHLPALAIVTAMDRNKAAAGGPAGPAALKETCEHAKKGLELLPGWQKPANIADADYQSAHDHMAAVFEGGSGFCALQAREFGAAKTHYMKSVESDPLSTQDMYQFSVAELESKPVEVNGFWHCAKAVKLATDENNAKGAEAIAHYCRTKYQSYHGSAEGWYELAAQVATQSAMPADFASLVKPAAAKPAGVKKNAVR